jgi:hypothetical protein
MDFNQTMRDLATYFHEVKELKEAGIDICKLLAHKTLYDAYLQQLIAVYGFNGVLAMLQYAEKNKVSDQDLEILYDLIYPTPTETEDRSEPLQVGTPATEDCNNPTSSEYTPPTVEAKFYINGELVSEEEYNKSIEKWYKTKRDDRFLDAAQMLRNILGF